ncbi:hypothetical protein MSSD14B_35600 [Marinobacter salsuginis]|uniref:Uncharacterized protein n=1 Tax=Marinobacter salsuginis TaxID=418719 RepID=A0A5M3Q3Z2_9GAMM|nr:hypothetical protein MSSD14B_35600 [Marinobacter salsuginis]
MASLGIFAGNLRVTGLQANPTKTHELKDTVHDVYLMRGEELHKLTCQSLNGVKSIRWKICWPIEFIALFTGRVWTTFHEPTDQ